MFSHDVAQRALIVTASPTKRPTCSCRLSKRHALTDQFLGDVDCDHERIIGRDRRDVTLKVIES